MRVLHVIPSIAAAHGGPSRAIVDMEKALSRRGIDVTTATTNDDGLGKTLDVRCNEPISAEPATRWYFRRDVTVYKVALGFIPWLRANVRNYDLVHVHALFSFMPVAAALLAARAGVPYVVRPL